MSNLPLGRPLCSSTVEKLLLEIEGQPLRTHARTQIPNQPKDYTKENIKRLKEIQAICRQTDSSPRNPVRALPSSEIPIQTSKPERVIVTKEKSANPFLTTVALVPSFKKPLNQINVPQGHPPLQRSNSESSLNGMTSLPSQACLPTMPFIRSPSVSNLVNTKKPVLKQTLPHELGSVPKYLQARKLQWKLDEEKKIKLSEQESVPAGHTLLSEHERLETLELLKKTQDEILRKMATLPLHFATLRAKQQKEDLDNQLKRTEEGLKIFSRPRVLIKHDKV